MTIFDKKINDDLSKEEFLEIVENCAESSPFSDEERAEMDQEFEGLKKHDPILAAKIKHFFKNILDAADEIHCYCKAKRESLGEN